MRRDDLPMPERSGRDRPSDAWVCGHADKVPPCGCGPLPDGRCPLQSAPCHPSRSWTGRRRAARNVVLVLGVGCLLAALGSPWRRTFLAPGPLAEPHAQLLGRAALNDRCAACHPAARNGIGRWFGLGGENHRGATQSDLCLECHHAALAPERALLPHNLESETLQQIRATLVAARKSDLASPVAIRSANAEISCSACHREHHGKEADLTWMSDTQCQTCHSQRFNHFASDHPDWDQWPYGRGGNIAFDHVSHQSTHFMKQDRPFDCRVCHQIDSEGQPARSGSFESSCADCHGKSLEIQTAGGVDLLALPTLDLEPLRDRGIAPGPWPPEAEGIEPLRLAPLMRLLLSADPETEAAIAELASPAAHLWTGPPHPRTAEHTRRVVEATRRLLEELSNHVPETIERRLALPGSGAIAGQLSRQTVQSARRQWFAADLDVNAPAGGSTAESPRPFDAETDLPHGGWYRDDLRLAIRYRGVGHADPVLRKMVEVANDPHLSTAHRQNIEAIPAIAACLVCHPAARDSAPASWTSRPSDFGRRTFTRFSHRPHLNLAELQACTSCHEPRATLQRTLTSRQETPTAQGTIAARESVASREFEPLSRDSCVRCHHPQGAGDGCADCHRYHVDAPSEPLRR